ncbi:putative conserved hypothetical protein [Colletotrichum sublineola]|uniref:Nephrocystin 3-like N-terminal domain-containing protein n=1 Tax=Colletotrichum sublineola TaxID=1173701 RepID=A0A066XHL2_COLSU|nr:putative conserved hypothetical protein [Colletotrichum sublineola]
MTDLPESGGGVGCLSVLSSCFKTPRGKPRPGISEPPNQSVPLASPVNKEGELSAPSLANDEIPPSTKHDHEAPVSLPPGSLAPSSSANNADEPVSVVPITTDQGPATTANAAKTLDLWQEAYNKAKEETRKWIDSNPPPANAEDPASELVELVRSSEEKHDKESLKLKVGDREILWRDYASRVVSVVTAIGDIAISFAPAPATTVWSAVKVLLEANVSEREDLVAIMGCTDIVLCLVRRGRVYEEVYIGEPPRPTHQEDLKNKLVEVYATCLDFLAFVNEEMQRKNLGRFLDALLDPKSGETQVSAVKALEQELQSAALPCEAKLGEKYRRLLQSLEGPLRRVDKNITTVLERLKEREKSKAMKYISAIPVGKHHNEKREKRTKGTCEWLVKHSRFLEWENSPCSSLFWLQGNTTGQTPSEHDEGFAFFYCNSSDPARQSIPEILKSYIRQLGEVSRHPESVHGALYSLYRKKEQIQSDITIEDCVTALVEMINSYPRTVLILDALDECKDTRQDLAKMFKRLVGESNHLLKIFIASRPEHDIGEYLGPFQGSNATIAISTNDNHGDIKTFVDTEVDNFTTNWMSETKQLVKNVLVEKSDGIWTYLQWEQLKEVKTNGSVKQRLGKLPTTLTDAYDEVYSRHEPESVDRVMLQRAVRWVMCAREPLDSCTLLSAIRVESEKTDGEKALDKSDLTAETLKGVCRHLVVRDPDLDVWKFPHASVAEHFAAKNEPWVKNAQAEVTIVLINCMIDCCSVYSSVWPPFDVSEDWWIWSYWFEARMADPDQTLDPRHPLQVYTRDNWLTHIHNLSEQDDRIEDVVLALKRFLGEEGPQQSSNEYQVFRKIIRHTSSRYGLWRHVSPSTNFVFGVVTMGLHRLLPGWWNRGVDLPSLVNDEGLDLLQIATYFGHYDLCQFLIGQGCNVNRLAGHEFKRPAPWLLVDKPALRMSVERRQIRIMELLLANGANTACVVEGPTLLCLAAGSGIEYCTALLEKGLNPNIRCSGGCSYGCALSSAAYHGNLDAMKALVSKGAEVNPENLDDRCGSPLAAAVTGGNLDSARFLLEKGADANAHSRGRGFGSPLIAAAYSGSIDCVRLLLEHNADVNANPEFDRYGSPLVAAVFWWQMDCARFLLEQGADANAHLKTGELGSPLITASSRGALNFVRLLLEHKADVNANPEIGRYGSPLAAAASMGKVDCARLLIEHGADVNAYLEFGEYGSVLAAAILGPDPSLDMIKFLVEEAKADLAQLAFVRPRRIEEDTRIQRTKRDKNIDRKPRLEWRYKHRKEEMDVAAYLLQEVHIEAGVLVSLGVPPRDLPQDTIADSEYEELDEHDKTYERWYRR